MNEDKKDKSWRRHLRNTKFIVLDEPSPSFCKKRGKRAGVGSQVLASRKKLALMD
jgi:hypothetical protein